MHWESCTPGGACVGRAGRGLLCEPSITRLLYSACLQGDPEGGRPVDAAGEPGRLPQAGAARPGPAAHQQEGTQEDQLRAGPAGGGLGRGW
jgi:hypothetical protein